MTVGNETALTPRILAFARSRQGLLFYMRDLLTYSRIAFPRTAPESPGRILRKLKAAGLIEYRLCRRAESLYEIVRVNG